MASSIPSSPRSTNTTCNVATKPKKSPDKWSLRWKNQRLLYIHHAITCKQDPCTVTPYCANLKEFWSHAIVCTEPQTCSIPECVSTREVLWHYRTCKTRDCKECGPAREEIKNMDSQRKEEEPDLSEEFLEGIETMKMET